MAAQGVGRIARPALAKRICEGLDTGSVLLVAGPGYGKSTAIEEALELDGRRSVWLSCGEAVREPARLLSELVERARAAVPGLGDVVGDALNTPLERLDVTAATTAFVVDIERLLVEPLVIVLDDAENLEGADAAIAVVDRLLNVRGVPLSLAIGTRVPLPLRLSKLRASGGLLELGQAELIFSPGEIEQLLQLRRGGAVSETEVRSVHTASQGWPIVVALTGIAPESAQASSPLPRRDLFRYLAEEVLGRLDEASRMGMVDSSVPAVLTPLLASDLGLAPEFTAEAEASGLFRRTDDSGTGTYHPLFLAFLRERLLELRTEAERESLHARVAANLAAAGEHEESIEHWLAAGRFDEAIESMAIAGPQMVRVSPERVASYLAALPAELKDRPDCLYLEAQLLSGAGDHEGALDPLRAAAAGFREAGQPEREWLTRVILADTLLFSGDPEQVAEVAEGWEEAEGVRGPGGIGGRLVQADLALDHGSPRRGRGGSPAVEWISRGLLAIRLSRCDGPCLDAIGAGMP